MGHRKNYSFENKVIKTICVVSLRQTPPINKMGTTKNNKIAEIQGTVVIGS